MIDEIFGLGSKMSSRDEIHDNNEVHRGPPLRRVMGVLLGTIGRYRRTARLFVKEV